jgi:chaperonin cofactor prefoldin
LTIEDKDACSMLYAAAWRLKKQLEQKIEQLDKRIETFEKPSNYDWSKKIERLHSEASAYEKVLKMIG